MQLKHKIKNKVKGLVFLIFGFFQVGNVIAQSDSDFANQQIRFESTTAEITNLLEEIEKQSTAKFIYDPAIIENLKVINLPKKIMSLGFSLDQIFEKTGVAFTIVEPQIILKKEKEVKKISNSPPVKVVEPKFTISGYISELNSKETLIGATVFTSKSGSGATSNVYGFYSLTLPQGNHELIFSYIGYEAQIIDVSLEKNLELHVDLSLGMELEEVVVVASQLEETTILSSEMSRDKIDMAEIKALPALMGERDVLKILQLKPGVQSGTDGSSGLYVRGGGPDQNLILLDGVPVYNANHLFGFFSTFNGDAIKNAEIIKAGFPARYGGRLSSIIDIRMKEGNMESYSGNVTVGLVAGKFSIEGPIVKDKTSFIFSGRRTWIDLITNAIQKGKKEEDPSIRNQSAIGYNFYDLNLKVNHKFSTKSRLYLSAYLGDDLFKDEWDRYYSKGNFSLGWGNKIGSLRWNYQLSPKLFSNTTLIYSQYNYNSNNENEIINNGISLSKNQLETASNIEDLGAKYDLSFVPNPNHYFRGGFGYTYHQFKPTVNTTTLDLADGQTNQTIVGEEKVTANEFSVYIEDDIKIGPKLLLNIGVNFSSFVTQNSNYSSFQPRISAGYKINEISSVNLSVSKMTQFVHLLTSPGLGLPTDLWVPSTDIVKPENSWQYAASYRRDLGKGYKLSLEGYFKQMENLLEYKAGFGVFSNSEVWENKVTSGKGTSYGGEILLEKTKGKTTGWIGYTLSRSDRQFADLNFGEKFPYKYDRRHDIGITVMHKPNDRVDFGLVWIYGTGTTYTLGTQSYLALDATTGNFDTGSNSNFGTVAQITSKNNNRLSAYHRLDLSVNFHKEKKIGKRTWSFGFYNIYNRLNPFLFYQDTNEEGGLVLKKLSILPVIPFFSYSLDF